MPLSNPSNGGEEYTLSPHSSPSAPRFSRFRRLTPHCCFDKSNTVNSLIYESSFHTSFKLSKTVLSLWLKLIGIFSVL